MALIGIVVYVLAGLFAAKYFAKDGIWEETERINIIFPNIPIVLFWPIVLAIHLAFMLFMIFKVYTR